MPHCSLCERQPFFFLLLVRHKVKELMDFIQDDERLREERKKAKKTKDKYIGMSSEYQGGSRYSESVLFFPLFVLLFSQSLTIYYLVKVQQAAKHKGSSKNQDFLLLSVLILVWSLEHLMVATTGNWHYFVCLDKSLCKDIGARGGKWLMLLCWRQRTICGQSDQHWYCLWGSL